MPVRCLIMPHAVFCNGQEHIGVGKGDREHPCLLRSRHPRQHHQEDDGLEGIQETGRHVVHAGRPVDILAVCQKICHIIHALLSYFLLDAVCFLIPTTFLITNPEHLQEDKDRRRIVPDRCIIQICLEEFHSFLKLVPRL